MGLGSTAPPSPRRCRWCRPSCRPRPPAAAPGSTWPVEPARPRPRDMRCSPCPSSAHRSPRRRHAVEPAIPHRRRGRRCRWRRRVARTSPPNWRPADALRAQARAASRRPPCASWSHPMPSCRPTRNRPDRSPRPRRCRSPRTRPRLRLHRSPLPPAPDRSRPATPPTRRHSRARRRSRERLSERGARRGRRQPRAERTSRHLKAVRRRGRCACCTRSGLSGASPRLHCGFTAASRWLHRDSFGPGRVRRGSVAGRRRPLRGALHSAPRAAVRTAACGQGRHGLPFRPRRCRPGRRLT